MYTNNDSKRALSSVSSTYQLKNLNCVEISSNSKQFDNFWIFEFWIKTQKISKVSKNVSTIFTQLFIGLSSDGLNVKIVAVLLPRLNVEISDYVWVMYMYLHTFKKWLIHFKF